MCATRSITATKKGTRSEISRSSIAQPRTARPAAQTSPGVPRSSSTPWSSEPMSSCAARPSWVRRVRSRAPGRSVNDAGGRSPPVVTVTAGIPRATNGPCSPRVNGKPRSISWARTLGRCGALPVWSAIRAAAVDARSAAVERGASPERSRRGAPCPAIAVRLTTPSTGKPRREAKRAAPSPPDAPPSVERKTRVCAGFTVGTPAAAFAAYPRASSTSAAVPLALLFAPGPAPVSSRCAITTIASRDCPGTTAQTFWSRTVLPPGSRPRQASVATRSPKPPSWSRTQPAAPSAPALPGGRFG